MAACPEPVVNPDMLNEIEDIFVAAGRTPKGRRARQAIFRALRRTVAQEGLERTSLSLVAARANLTQAALRHHFPSRDELLTSYFVAGTQWLQLSVRGLLSIPGTSPHDALRRCVEGHLQFMEGVDTVYWLESSAYWLRHRSNRRTRDAWYRWLLRQYAGLIREARPDLREHDCGQRALAVLTLTLGAWITHGSGSSMRETGDQDRRREVLVNAALQLAFD